MRVVDTKEARGSLRWIRVVVNEWNSLLDEKVFTACRLMGNAPIEWVSPLEDDGFAEYRDDDFLRRLGVSPARRALDTFWPKFGPQWDALARRSTGEVLLVEAKANIPEVVSPATTASPDSRKLIESSLAETKTFLRVDRTIQWSGRLYQYANRLAHLYFLRELNRIPAYLVFVYFIGDKDVGGPETEAEWKAALTVAKKVLGINERNPLGRYVSEVFIDVRQLSSA